MDRISKLRIKGLVIGQLAPAAVRFASPLAAMLTLIVAPIPVQAQQSPMAEYRLGAGDRIAVVLPLNPELNSAGLIGPDGRFSMPLAGRVNLAGRTLAEAEIDISAALRNAHLVANANPNISVTTYGGAVYVGGEVRTPGSVPLVESLNPMQAIIRSGGMLDTAKSRKVAIIRRSDTGPAQIITVDIRDYVRNGSRAQDVTLSPGDIIFVPKSGIAEVNLWLDQHINKIIPNALNFHVNLSSGNGSSTVVDSTLPR